MDAERLRRQITAVETMIRVAEGETMDVAMGLLQDLKALHKNLEVVLRDEPNSYVVVAPEGTIFERTFTGSYLGRSKFNRRRDD